MDRLICGDVGYGKTEIAVRAAFKAVQDGRQVAVLVPDHAAGPAAHGHVQRAVRTVPGGGAGRCRGSSATRRSAETLPGWPTGPWTW